MIGITDVVLGKENPMAFLLNKSDLSVIDLNIKECEVITTDCIFDVYSGRVRKIHNEPPLAWPAAVWDDAD